MVHAPYLLEESSVQYAESLIPLCTPIAVGWRNVLQLNGKIFVPINVLHLMKRPATYENAYAQSQNESIGVM